MEVTNVEQDSNSKRKLASIQEVAEINPHLNSDRLALAKILGWQVVIKKEEFQIGEKVVYFEIDSLLPDKPWSEFIKAREFKVKTIKLRGEISQGLILPLKILGDNINEDDYQIGENLTEVIGVTRFDHDAEYKSAIVVKTSTFPDFFVEKTDEPRIQSNPGILNKFTGQSYYATLKYDGTSATYLIDPKDPEQFYICSRNLTRDYDPNDIYSTIADEYKIKENLLKFDCRYAIQGEIYGPKISKNYLQASKVSFVVFSIKDLVSNIFLDMQELIDTCKKLNLRIVEIVEVGESFNYSVEELKKLSKGNYPGTKNPREGLVFRLQKEWNKLYRLSFKIINDDFLIKHAGN
jgi:RNA ligase (TIGR02306 family)